MNYTITHNSVRKALPRRNLEPSLVLFRAATSDCNAVLCVRA